MNEKRSNIGVYNTYIHTQQGKWKKMSVEISTYLDIREKEKNKRDVEENH